MFTESETRFLRQEHATSDGRLGKIADLRELGCPERIVNRILEQRAKKIGFVREAPERPNAADLF